MSSNKSFSTETSERYSRALFEVLKESKELEASEQNIRYFQTILVDNSEISNFIKDPTQSKTQQNIVINFVSRELGFSKNLNNFLLLLVQKRRIFFVKKIFDSFLKLCSKKRGEIKASLTSSKELSETEIDEISKDLSKTLGSTIKFDYKFDKKLIGGLKLQLGSFMIDTSIKNKLKKFEQILLEN